MMSETAHFDEMIPLKSWREYCKIIGCHTNRNIAFVHGWRLTASLMFSIGSDFVWRHLFFTWVHFSQDEYLIDFISKKSNLIFFHRQLKSISEKNNFGCMDLPWRKKFQWKNWFTFQLKCSHQLFYTNRHQRWSELLNTIRLFRSQ